ncbi:MAG: hypothetical protein F4039_01300 [Gammaproteobacteria bacterium]|nr:hypothetical protein [Gammaproteobacteria bacterium]
MSSLVREFEPSVPTIRSWLAAVNGGSASRAADLQQENRRLRRCFAKVEEEKAILEKAAVWFAKETLKTPRRSSSLSRGTGPNLEW